MPGAEADVPRVIPCSHKLEQMAHRDTFSPDNLLSRGQEVMVDVNRGSARLYPPGVPL